MAIQNRSGLISINAYNRPYYNYNGLLNNNASRGYNGLFNSQLQAPNTAPPIDWSNPLQSNAALGQTADLANSFGTNSIDLSQSNQLLSSSIGGMQGGTKGGGKSMNWGAAAGAMASAIPDKEIKLGNTTYKRGAWDLLDPTYQLAGNKSSAVGDGLSDAGVMLTKSGLQSGNYYLALAGAAAKIGGSIVNAGWGMEEDKAAVQAADALKGTTNDVDSLDQIRGLSLDGLNMDPYKGGWFVKGKAAKKNAAFRDQVTNDLGRYYNSMDNSARKIMANNMADMNLNYSALGGPIKRKFGDGGDKNPIKNPLNFTIPTIEDMEFEIKAKEPEETGEILRPKEVIATAVHTTPDAPYTVDNVKDDIRDFYVQDFTKRRLTYHPEESAERITRLFDRSKIIGDNTLAKRNIGGSYSPVDGNIRLNPSYTPVMMRSDAVHEMRHLMDDKLGGLTPAESEILHNAYDLKSNRNGYKFIEDEYPTVNTQLRHDISEKHGNVLGEDLDKVITNMSDAELFNTLYWLNGYTNYAGKYLDPKSDKQKDEAKKKAAAIRKALLEVAQNTPAEEGNLAAFGGHLYGMNNDDTGAINYGFMNDYLTLKKKEADIKNKMSGISPISAFVPNRYAIGGDLQTNGADWSDGLVTIGAGGSHESNPYEGVQMGVDNENVPNLVEEGETIYNDYVFSNRILADDTTKRMFRLPRKKDITFADISKRLEKEIAERPNDPISRKGFEAQMQMLEEQQERQKQEMEAARAREAFEALSPEEQTVLMQQRAEQEAMAQQVVEEQALAEQQAIQQPSPDEVAMMQQQMQADGSQAALGQEAPMMAEGGNLFKKGGYKWDKFWSPVNEYSKKKGNTKGKYQIDKEWKGNIKELEDSEAYKAFTNYILNDATDEERMKYFQWIDANTGRDNKYITDGKLTDNWKDRYQAARTDGLYGIQHYTPEWQVAEATSEPSVLTPPSSNPTPRVFHAMVDDDDYIQGELDPNVVGAEVRRETLPNGDVVIYHDRAKAAPTSEDGGDDSNITPVKRWTGLRYAGLLGPAVGLGMQLAGVGKPNTAQLDAAISNAGKVVPARWKPLGNYLTYRPLDIWYAQNALNAQSRATDRSLMNTSGGNRGTAMAGLLANGYNSQLASGNLFRQALEYNDNLEKQVAEFNRGTDQFNSEQFGTTSRFNADAYNRAAQADAQLRLSAAAQKMNADAGWYNGLYGNVSGLFKGLGDLGRENRDTNWRNALATSGAFGVMDEDALVDARIARYKKGKKSKSKGGKINKKRGLTF